MKRKLNVLFLCTGNSCRSQMAEGFCRELKNDHITAYSAGVETHGLNPHAVAVMAEAGVDISGHSSKNVSQFLDMDLDAVVTVCSHAHESCPFFPAKCPIIHQEFDDPPRLARELAEKGAGKEEQLDCYRRVRDEIRFFVEGMPENLKLNRETKNGQ